MGHHRTASWTREVRSELSGRSSLVSTNHVTDDDDIIVLDWRLVWERITMLAQSITAEGSAGSEGRRQARRAEGPDSPEVAVRLLQSAGN